MSLGNIQTALLGKITLAATHIWQSAYLDVQNDFVMDRGPVGCHRGGYTSICARACAFR
jgi:hypothetical protein